MRKFILTACLMIALCHTYAQDYKTLTPAEYRKLAKVMASAEEYSLIIKIKDSTISILDETIVAKDQLIGIGKDKILKREQEIEKQKKIILMYRIGITALGIISLALLFN